MSETSTKKHKRGNKVNVLEVQRRMNFVEDALTRGMPEYEIIRLACAQLACSEATVKRYLLQTHHRVRASRDVVRASEVDLRLNRLYKLATKLEREKVYGPLTRIETLITDIVGARAPQKVQISGTITHLVTAADLRKFSDHDLAEAEKLNAKFLETARERGVLPAHSVIDGVAESVSSHGETPEE